MKNKAKRIISAITLFVFLTGNVSFAAQGYINENLNGGMHLAPPLVLNSVTNRSHQEMMKLGSMKLGMYLLDAEKTLKFDYTSTAPAPDLGTLRDAFKTIASVEDRNDGMTGFKEKTAHGNVGIELYYYRLEYLGGHIFSIPMSIIKNGRRYDYQLVFSTLKNNETGYCPVFPCHLKEFVRLKEKIKVHARIYDRLPERSEGLNDKQKRDVRGKFIPKPGRSPEDAFKVIAISPFLQKCLKDNGYFTLDEYHQGYNEARKLYPDLKLSELPENPETQSRDDLAVLEKDGKVIIDKTKSPYEYSLAEIALSETTAIQRLNDMGVLALASTNLNAIVGKVAQTGPDAMVGMIMKDQALVKALLDTGNWDNESDLRRTLRDVAFGADPKKTLESARQMVATMKSREGDPMPPLMVASTLMDRRVDAPEFMPVANELLLRIDPTLGENLEGLLSKDTDVQWKAFQWLFDRLIKEANEMFANPEQGMTHMLIAKIILKQINIVLVKTDEEKWQKLRNYIIMRFAEELHAEAMRETQPLIAVFMWSYPDVSETFFFAVDKNFVLLAKNYDNKEYESFCQAVETLLSFACLVWPDRFFDYLKSHYPHASSFIRAHYLWSMKFGMNTRGADRKPALVPERLEFVIANAIDLCGDKDIRVQNKCKAILRDLGEAFVQHMEKGKIYPSLDKGRRKVLIDLLIGLGITNAVEGGRSRVLPFVMHEISQENNVDIQKDVLIRDYFTDEFLSNLTSEQGKTLRKCIILNYSDFKSNDIVDKACQRIMVWFGYPAIREAYDFFAEKAAVNYEHAIAILFLAARVASVCQINNPDEIVAIRGMIGKVTGLAERLIAEKITAIDAYFKLQEEISKAKSEIEMLRTNSETASSIIGAINMEVNNKRNEHRQLGRDIAYYDEQKTTMINVIKGLYIQIAQARIMPGKIRQWLGGVWRWVTRKSVTPLTDAELERMAIGGALSKEELKELERQVAERKAELAQIEGELYAKKAKREKLFKELQKLEEEQVALAEELSGIVNRFKELDKFLKYAEEKGIADAMTKVKDASVKTNDICNVLRLFIKCSSMDLDTVKKCYDRLGAIEEQAILTRLAISADQRFSQFISSTETESTLTSFIPTQAEHMVYRDGIISELEYLGELWKNGLLIPQSSESPLLKLLIDTTRMRLRQQSQTKKVAALAAVQERARRTADAAFKKAIDEVLRVTGAAADSLLEAMEAFLKFKFKHPKDQCIRTNPKLFGLFMSFVYAVNNPEIGPEKALELLFFTISGQSGKYFIAPEEQKIEKPKNYIEVIEMRYRRYFEAAQQFRKVFYETEKELSKATAGFGWDTDTNDRALYLFNDLFNQQGSSKEVRAQAEGILAFTFLNWLNTWKTPNEKEGLNVAQHAVLANLGSYINSAPVINPEKSDEVQGYYNPRMVVMVCHEFAKKVNGKSDELNPTEIKYSIDLLEKMEKIIPEQIVYKHQEEEVRLLSLIKEALEKLRKRQAQTPDQNAWKTLPKPRPNLSLPFGNMKTPQRPALPGPGQPRDEGGKYGKKPGRSPENALKVIMLSQNTNRAIQGKGYFDITDYRNGYNEIREQFSELGFAELPSLKNDSQSREDLYALEMQGILSIDRSVMPYRFKLMPVEESLRLVSGEYSLRPTSWKHVTDAIALSLEANAQNTADYNQKNVDNLRDKFNNDGKSALIFSEKVTFDEGIGVLLPKLASCGIKVAVIATSLKQKELIARLNIGKSEAEKIVAVENIESARSRLGKEGFARYYYFKVKGDPDIRYDNVSSFDITQIVKKIIEALGHASNISVAEQQKIYEATRKFAEAA